MTVLFNIFIRQTLTDDFWGLHKNMNCAFPLTMTPIKQTSYIATNHFNFIYCNKPFKYQIDSGTGCFSENIDFCLLPKQGVCYHFLKGCDIDICVIFSIQMIKRNLKPEGIKIY